MKTLIIRTDRLGDFYATIPYINCLKRVLGKKNIEIVVKEHIYNHIKKKKYIFNKIYFFPEKSFLKKFFFVYKLRKKKYKQIIILDGKDRSLIISKFLKADKIYLTFPQKKRNFITNLIFTKMYNVFFDDLIIPLNHLYKKILNKLNIKIIKNDYKILLYKNIKKIDLFKRKKIARKKYVHIHLDEKWFSNFYIKQFYNISPNVNDFYKFLKKILHYL